MTKKISKPNASQLSAIHSSVLDGRMEADLMEYVNWADGLFGLSSKLGVMGEKLLEGVYGIEFAKDPETQIIRSLDAIARFRVIHRAMTNIGPHARTLIQCYVVAKKPAYVEAALGRWYSGIALSVAPDVSALVDACRDAALGTPEQKRKANDLIASLRRRAAGMYNTACREYVAALGNARSVLARQLPGAIRHVPTIPHHCRVSTIYPCPCKR